MSDSIVALANDVVRAYSILCDAEKVAFIFIFGAALVTEVLIGMSSSKSTRTEDCLIAAVVALACTLVEFWVFLRVTLSFVLLASTTITFLLSLSLRVYCFEKKED